ncbi:MAG TPA: UDP-glucose/GDP-mannose dehydrogenase family protein [Blastocatellia bacterium]|nr:UDP-glucose/GDP-mannose dehydrogenase family protein [Blastocatellia bacterium]
MKVVVAGTGYVGLVTGAVLSYTGHSVFCLDVDAAKIEQLKAGRSPIFEPGLDELIKVGFENKRLFFSSDYSVVHSANVIFITVGTPSIPTGSVDLSYVKAAAIEIGRRLDPDLPQIIVNKSTVPVGCGNWVEMLVAQGMQMRAGAAAGAAGGFSPESAPINPSLAQHRFAVVSNPEFLREGSAVYDSFYPDRLVVGTSNRWALNTIRDLYAPILEQNFTRPSFLEPKPERRGAVPLVVTDPASAEMIKYTANALLATKISFANEIAAICESVGADVTEVMRGVGLDHRIGKEFLNAGPGWGGSCFGKDLSALIAIAEEYGLSPSILSAAKQVNRSQRSVAIKKLQTALKIMKGRVIGLLGLAFKPNTDDVRDAPSLDIAEQLLGLGAMIKVYDPVAENSARRARPDLELIYCRSIEDVAAGADALVIVTEWEEFRSLKLSQLKKIMRTPVLVDTRNIINPSVAASSGFEYYGMGR